MEEVVVAVMQTQVSVWEALAGRAPGQPVGPADPGLWSAVVERLNPARARPVLRPGVEDAQLVSVRGVSYVMLRSPDPRGACYLRLTPQERELAALMDGTRTVARLVAEFAKITGRLAPDQVTRIVADLAGNRMLQELPVDAFRRLDRVHRRPWPARFGRGLLAFARGRRVIIARVDPFVGFLYKAGGRLLFTRPAAVLVGLVALAGLGLFGWTWARGAQQIFLTGGSYASGAAVLLGLNVLALACHELGHALATRHAGRRVPAAGFLIYFGIPSVFVDTTDVWMAGRRARLITTAAGPATGLFLAGVAQLVALADPALAPWCFKLAFAWYLNAAFNLNPFLALDGYYLLMDWLEIPNLRPRGLAWVAARLRRRPPRFGALDREGRLIALYGMLSLVWLIIAVNLAYRIYVDRVSGLFVGLWRAGWWQRALLVAVVAGLAAPAVFAALSWLRRLARRARIRLTERRLAADAPRRADALRLSTLGSLSAPAIERLAGVARWVHPRTGEQLVFAGAAQPRAFVVVDGAMEGRRPGDPAGTVRERVGPGGVVGLASALTGTPAPLAWYTAGTTLLAVPASTLAAAIGPLPGPPPADRAELENLFDRSPAFQGLSTEDRLGLASQARPVDIAPGQPVVLPGPGTAALIAAGLVDAPDGRQLPAGALVGPYPDEPERPPVARTPVRVWLLPAIAGLPLLLGPVRPAAPGLAGVAPAFGAHPASGYPPLAAPPGPPPPVDPDQDRRFERKLWWLLILLLLFALLLTGANILPAKAWAEMPGDKALLHVNRGTVSATVNGQPTVLHAGDQVYVGEADQVRVGDRSTGQLTFRGGGLTVLCGGSTVDVGVLESAPGTRIAPSGQLALRQGRLLADTAARTAAFAPLALDIAAGTGQVANTGTAQFSVSGGGGVEVGAGTVTRDGTPVPATGATMTCGDGVSITPVPSPAPTDSPSESPSPSPSPSDSPSASPSASPSLSPSTAKPTPTPTKKPTPTPSPTTSPPPVDNPPVITWVTDPGASGAPLDQEVNSGTAAAHVCNNGPTTMSVVVSVTDDIDPAQSLIVIVHWSGFASGSGRMNWDGNFYGTLGPIPYTADNKGGSLAITVTATDLKRHTSTIRGTTVTVLPCVVPIIF